jgi:hypothetical protein
MNHSSTSEWFRMACDPLDVGQACYAAVVDWLQLVAVATNWVAPWQGPQDYQRPASTLPQDFQTNASIIESQPAYDNERKVRI